MLPIDKHHEESLRLINKLTKGLLITKEAKATVITAVHTVVNTNRPCLTIPLSTTILDTLAAESKEQGCSVEDLAKMVISDYLIKLSSIHKKKKN